eukprot:32221-Prorocentrum_minimum.AAC.2
MLWAPQATEPAVLIPLTRLGVCHVLLVGDPRQLPPTVVSHTAAALGLGQSLFEQLMEAGMQSPAEPPTEAQPEASMRSPLRPPLSPPLPHAHSESDRADVYPSSRKISEKGYTIRFRVQPLASPRTVLHTHAYDYTHI